MPDISERLCVPSSVAGGNERENRLEKCVRGMKKKKKKKKKMKKKRTEREEARSRNNC